MMKNNVEPQNNFQTSEVSGIRWLNLNSAINYIREYNLEKINLLRQVNEILLKYNLYS